MEEQYYSPTSPSTASSRLGGAVVGNLAQANKLPNPSEIERLNKRIAELTDRAAHLTGVLGDIADRTFGSCPTDGPHDASCQPCRSGRLGDVQDNLDRLSMALDAAATQADRLTAL